MEEDVGSQSPAEDPFVVVVVVPVGLAGEKIRISGMLPLTRLGCMSMMMITISDDYQCNDDNKRLVVQ